MKGYSNISLEPQNLMNSDFLFTVSEQTRRIRLDFFQVIKRQNRVLPCSPGYPPLPVVPLRPTRPWVPLGPGGPLGPGIPGSPGGPTGSSMGAGFRLISLMNKSSFNTSSEKHTQLWIKTMFASCLNAMMSGSNMQMSVVAERRTYYAPVAHRPV